MDMQNRIAADVARKKAEQEKAIEPVMKRLKKTQPGETICLMYWEVEALLKYINRKG